MSGPPDAAARRLGVFEGILRMAVSASRRALRFRAVVTTLSAVLTVAAAVGGQVAAGGPARAAAAHAAAGAPCPCSVFPESSAPATADSGDPYSVVLGV